MNVPASLRIGAYDYKVDIIPTTDDDEGECDFNMKQIKTVVDNRSDAMTTNTLLHEALHGVFGENGLHRLPGYTDTKEELIVNAMANGVCQILRDNPDFARSLFAAWVPPKEPNA